jgi:CBS domain-containing protein
LIFVKDIMTREVKTIEGSKTVLEAARAMSKAKVGSLVITEKDKPVGIVTEGDISRAVGKGLDPKATPLKKIMGGPLITTTRDARVEEAARLMAGSSVKKLPVVEGGKVVGMVTQTDIIGVSYDLVTSLKEMVRARYRPPDFQP